MSKTARRWIGQSNLSDEPINDNEPDTWEDANLVTTSDVSRQVNDQGEPPPNILTKFAKSVVPVYAQPSDQLFMYTYALTGGQTAVQIYNQQDAGVGCQVTLINYGDGLGAGDVLISTDKSFLVPSTSGAHQSAAIKLEGPATGVQGALLMLSTRQPLFAICVDNVTANLGVIVEIYNPDTHTWDSWVPGQEG